MLLDELRCDPGSDVEALFDQAQFERIRHHSLVGSDGVVVDSRGMPGRKIFTLQFCFEDGPPLATLLAP